MSNPSKPTTSKQTTTKQTTTKQTTTKQTTTKQKETGTKPKPGPSGHPSKATKHSTSEQFRNSVIQTYVGSEAYQMPAKSKEDKEQFAQKVADNFSKLGKNPTDQEFKGVMKSLGLKYNPNRKFSIDKKVDFTSSHFKNQVMETFVGMGENIGTKDIEKALLKLGILMQSESSAADLDSDSDMDLLSSSRTMSFNTAPRPSRMSIVGGGGANLQGNSPTK